MNWKRRFVTKLVSFIGQFLSKCKLLVDTSRKQATFELLHNLGISQIIMEFLIQIFVFGFRPTIRTYSIPEKSNAGPNTD